MNKKLCILLVALLVISSMVVACTPAGTTGGGQTTTKGTTATTKATTASIVSAPGEFPVVKQSYTLRVFAGQPANVEDLLTNRFTKMYEEKSGVKVEWELVPSGDAGDMKLLSLAGGDYPDVYAVGMSKADEMKYGGSVLQPLKALIDEHSVWFKEELDSVNYVRDMVTSFDGDIYCYPVTTYDESHLLTKNRYWINSTWLKELGIDRPTTTDELYNALVAFKTKDPNKNGQQDEIPLILTTPYTSAYFMCAFIYDDGERRIRILDDGKVDPVFNKDEFREGLRFLNKLFKEGLTDTTAFTLNAAATKELFEGGDHLRVGSVSGLYQGSFANIDGERQAQFDALPPVKGPAGVQLAGTYPYVHGTGSTSCTVALKDPEVFVRWMDWFYSFEGGLELRTGPEGEYWQRPPAGSKSYAGMDATWERLTSFGVTQNVCWSGLSMGHSHSMHGHLLGKPDQFYEAAGLEDRLIYYTKEYLPFRVDEVLPPLYVPADISTEYFKIEADLKKYVEESFVAFVTGRMSLDTDWQGYLDQLKTIGLEKYIQWTQAAYDSYLAVH